MFDRMIDDTFFWSAKGSGADVVISTRLRLARNHGDMPFPAKQSEEEREKITARASDFLQNSQYAQNLSMHYMDDIDEMQRRFLRERNIITADVEKNPFTHLIEEKNHFFELFINNEDHFQIQVLRSGLNLHDAYTDIVAVDTELNKFAPYAWSERYGYLSSSLENTGTGLKASVLVHLPILNLLGTIVEVTKMAEELGVSFSAVTENESRNYGSFYIVSNRSAGGKSEVEILELVEAIVRMIIDIETESRDEYVRNLSAQLEDKIGRSFGVLAHSRLLSYNEALEHLSLIRLGVVLAIIKTITLEQVNDLFVRIQPAHLYSLSSGRIEKASDYDTYRSELVRETLKGNNA